jgi:hypothetical protein
VIIVKELDVNQVRMKNPVAFVRVQEKVKTTSIVDIFIYFQELNRANVYVSKNMFLRKKRGWRLNRGYRWRRDKNRLFNLRIWV